MNRRKFIIFIIMLVITIPICIYISNIIHLSLLGEFVNISNIEFWSVIESLVENEKQRNLYLLLQALFILFLIFVFYIQKDNVYESTLVYVTNKIRTPAVAGQGQYGTARWLTEHEHEEIFKKNILDREQQINNQRFDAGGLVVGFKRKKKKEEIFYVGDNTHSLTIGATRSGKTRTIVLETIGNLGLAGESMILSDPKGEIYDYTAEFLEKLGYEIFVIDFKSKNKSSKYNFLQPIIDAVNEEDYQKAEELAWDLTASLVGDENSKMEPIWRDGEMSIIAGTMIAVVYENKEHPEFQNLTNVFSFISEMCRTEGNTMPINNYIKNLDESNPASRIFGIARIAPEKTRGSFFTAALTTLKLFTSEGIYGMTCESDFSLKDTGKKKRAIYMIVQDDKTTYYSLASLFVNQQYTSLVEVADERGGRLERRTNFILDEFREFLYYSCI